MNFNRYSIIAQNFAGSVALVEVCTVRVLLLCIILGSLPTLHIVVMRSDEQEEEVQIPEMVEPQKVLVMLPRDPHDSHNRPAVTPKPTGSAGVMSPQAPGECTV